jgi:hypothetical protein
VSQPPAIFRWWFAYDAYGEPREYANERADLSPNSNCAKIGELVCNRPSFLILSEAKPRPIENFAVVMVFLAVKAMNAFVA